MKARYSRANADKPWLKDRVTLTSRRLTDGRERVYVTRVYGLDRVEKGHKDFPGMQERWGFFDQMREAMTREGWETR